MTRAGLSTKRLDPATIFVPTYIVQKTPCVTFPQTENNCELLWTMEGTRYQDAAVLSAAQIIISDDAPLGFDVLGTALIVLHNPDAAGTPGDPALDPARGGAGQRATVPWETILRYCREPADAVH